MATFQAPPTLTDGSTLDQLGSGGSLELKDGAVTNAKVNAAAAIAYSKLALTGAILNADIAAAAGIAVTKLAQGTVKMVFQGSGKNLNATQGSTNRVGLNEYPAAMAGGGAVANFPPLGVAGVISDFRMDLDASGSQTGNTTAQLEKGSGVIGGVLTWTPGQTGIKSDQTRIVVALNDTIAVKVICGAVVGPNVRGWSVVFEPGATS